MAANPERSKRARKLNMKPKRTTKTIARARTDPNVVVGENAYKIRKDLDLTQANMAERTGLHPNAISALERGKKNMTLASLGDLAAAYGVDPHALLCGPDYGVSPPGSGVTLDTLARLTGAIDARVQGLLVKNGPVAIAQSHLAAILGALFDAISNNDKYQPNVKPAL